MKKKDELNFMETYKNLSYIKLNQTQRKTFPNSNLYSYFDAEKVC